MSDYLWDKTGEPEEDVAELEQLLGTLRYEPRPLAIPEELRARTARTPFRPQRSFKWQRLAVAASLLLTLLAGAWLITRFNQKEVRRESAHQPNGAHDNSAPHQTASAPQQQTASAPNGAHEQNASSPAPSPAAAPPEIERVNYHPSRRVSKRAGARAKRPAPQVATRREQLAHMRPEQREAMEKFLLAMRITSAKLNYAQREVQEMSAARRPQAR
jgi:cytoskeletal protein RodZ